MRNPADDSNGSAPLLEVDRLAVTFYTPRGTYRAVREASFEIRRGEVLGLVGESGCGKSTVAYAMMGYLPGTAQVDGAIRFEGKDIAHISDQELGKLRGDRIAMVYQDPVTSLNPSMKVGPQIEEVLRRHKKLNAGHAREKVVDLFENVRLADPERIGGRYPHQLSGGQQQRVVIAMALACDPDLLIMDEPTTGLDVTTEATILDLVSELKERVNAGILFVSHNLGVIARVADRVAVMYAGQIVEQASVRDVFKNPKHPYTVGLLRSVPKPVGEEGTVPKLSRIPGSVYSASEADAEACVFAPRCPLVQESCQTQAPRMEEVGENHLARCFFWKDVRSEIWGETEPREHAPEERGEPVISAKGLRRFYGRWQRKYMLFGPRVRPPVRAVNSIDFELRKGKTLGIVGESGSGKTTVARVVAGLVPRDRGEMKLHGQDLAPDVGDRTREQQAAIRMIFQNPTASLNPKLPIRHAITRALRKFAGLGKRESDERARELLEAVGLDPSYLDSAPSELSGGQQQRVAIAGAFAANPDVIVADEAVSALDVSVQAQVLNLLQEHQQAEGTSYIFITHDLGVVRYVSDDILVMYAGHVAESGPAEHVLTAPFHPYTEALLSAAPVPDPDAKPTEIRLEGAVPTMRERFQGCFFAGRCPRKIGSICDETPPPARTGPDSPDHVINCHIPVEELAVLQSEKDPQPAS
ncbi:MAG: ABC transporter ATP-binding protein [Chloroflexi bacterium]|nr:ABC transporter ATP-binding protein [Chloroflexota bacterium]